MIEPGSTNRASRNRRIVASMAWAGLLLTTAFLWSARQNGSIRSSVAEPICFLLASFAALVGVFAWMLFNPNRRSARESGSLFFAAAATLFPPPIIGFCLMPADSPLRGWLAFAVFMLAVIAVLSHIPDEFFGVPRGRHTYLIPIPAFDRVKDSAMDPDAAWFRFTDLSQIVADTERPSLAPRSYLQRENPRSDTRPPVKIRPASDVDDILGTDLDLGFLDESLTDVEAEPTRPTYRRKSERQRSQDTQPRSGHGRSDSADPKRSDGSSPRMGAAVVVDDQPPAFPPVLPHVPSSLHSVVAEPTLPPSGDDVADAALRDNTSWEQLQHSDTDTDTENEARHTVAEVPEPRPAPKRASRYDAMPTQSVSPSSLGAPIAESPKVESLKVQTPQAESPKTDAREIDDPSSSGLQRTQDESGSEVVEGVIKVRFDKGQKRANLHVPFSPPLAGMPDVECECVGDEALRLKVPVRQSYGIRIEARRSNADEALDTEVGFAAVCATE
jgi:hypothetical protein